MFYFSFISHVHASRCFLQRAKTLKQLRNAETIRFRVLFQFYFMLCELLKADLASPTSLPQCMWNGLWTRNLRQFVHAVRPSRCAVLTISTRTRWKWKILTGLFQQQLMLAVQWLQYVKKIENVNIVYYLRAARGWIITGKAITRYMRKYVQVHTHT